MAVIASRHHPLVKAFRASARGDDPRALIDGWHLVREAAASGVRLDVAAVAGAVPETDDEALLARVAKQGLVVAVTDAVMKALSPVRSPSGIVALAEPRRFALRDLLQPVPPLVLVAVDLQDPGNVGAVIRAAEAGGATGVALTGASADPWSWKALRAAMGSTFRLPVLRHLDAGGLCDELLAAGLRLVAATPRDGDSMHDAHFERGTALLLGGEGGGLLPDLVRRADARISIPMRGRVESLNAAVAAGVLVYEAMRQRTARTGAGV